MTKNERILLWYHEGIYPKFAIELVLYNKRNNEVSDFYGHGESELVIREALKPRERGDIFIAVKFGGMLTSDDRFYGIDVRPQNVQNYLVYTLKRLGTDYVELYQPARINPHIPVEDTIGAVLRRHTYASGSYQGQRIDL